MNRRSFAVGTLLLVAVSAFPQQPAADDGAVRDAAGVPTVEAQMKLFTTRLNLSADQQARLQPILQHLHDTTVNSIRNESISPEERRASIHAERLRTDKRIREVLTNDQKKTLDQIEQEPHPELHGSIH
jgi:Spy/CpxP family protein refolding chaperone